MYLIDTNILLEIPLRQKQANIAKRFLEKAVGTGLFLTDFSLHFVGVVLFRLNKHEVFLRTVNDLVQGGVRVIQLGVEDIASIVEIAQAFQLNFDDAYQYAAAQKHNLIIISLDADFDRTKRGRKTPDQALQELTPQQP